MTVLIAVTTRDAVIMAADSQGSVTRPILNIKDLSEFFESDKDRRLRTGGNGQPVLDTWSQIAANSLEIPYQIHSSVQKIFSLEPLHMGVMTSGVASFGDRTIKSLIAELKTTTAFVELSLIDYTLERVAELMRAFLRPKYEESCSETMPPLELMICGYDKKKHTPGVIRVRIHENRILEPDYDFCVFLGGITREIQRMLFGIDAAGKSRLIERSSQVLTDYHDKLEQFLKEKDIAVSLPAPDYFGDELRLFHNLDMGILRMNCATYSEQEGIECAEFLVNTMIKAQRFSDQFPTTGGTVQTAIVKKYSGFHFVPQRPDYLDA